MELIITTSKILCDNCDGKTAVVLEVRGESIHFCEDCFNELVKKAKEVG